MKAADKRLHPFLELRNFDLGGTAGTDGEEFNPFPGLRSFEPHEDFLFFGRDRQIDELVRRLRIHRFVAVLGTSGSGKSSLVRAGLIPSLEGGAMAGTGSGWRIAVFRPGGDPFQNLGEALSRVLIDSPDDLKRDFLQANLRASGLGLVECVRQAALPAGEKLLVVADQFEEVFRFKEKGDLEGSREQALAFVRILLEAAREEGVPIYIVLTLRSDYIGQCMEFPNLPEAINQGLYLVPRMTRDELRTAITGPVAVGGAEIAPSLVVRLLNDIGDNQDQLPILQHALMRTWESWRRDRTGQEIGLDHYLRVGTMSGALDQHAEEAYQEVEKLPRGPEIAEKLFRALTEKDSEGKGVRRLVPLAEVVELTGATTGEVAAVVEAFRRRSFLMPPPNIELRENTVLDLSHESLMRIWTRLAGWVDAEALSAQTYRDLAYRATTNAAPLRDPELQTALLWRDKETPTPVWAQRYHPAFEQTLRYLRDSELERERVAKEREATRRRQLWLAYGLAALLAAVAILIAIFYGTVKQKNEALEKQRGVLLENQRTLERQKHELEEQADQLEVSRVNLFERTLELSNTIEKLTQSQQVEQKALEQAKEKTVLAQKSAREADTAKKEALTTLGQLQVAQGEIVEQAANVTKQRDAAQTAQGEAERQHLLSLARETALKNSRAQHRDKYGLSALLSVQAYLFNRDAGGEPDQPEINVALREALGRIKKETAPAEFKNAVRALVHTPNEGFLATDEDGEIRALNSDLASLWSRGTPGGGVRSLAVKGKSFAIGSVDGALWLWENGIAGRYRTLVGPGGRPMIALAFVSPRRLVSAKADGEVSLWDLEKDAKPFTLLPGDRRPVHSIAVDPATGRAAAAVAGGALLWDLSQPSAQPRTVCFLGDKKENEIRSVAFGPKGELACGTGNGEVRLVDASGRTGDPLTGHKAAVNALAFSPDGHFLASGSADKTVGLWDVRGKGAKPVPRPIELRGPASWVWAVAFSADGSRLAAASEDKTVRIWTVRSDDLAAEICRSVKQRLTEEDWNANLPDLPYREYTKQKACMAPGEPPR